MKHELITHAFELLIAQKRIRKVSRNVYELVPGSSAGTGSSNGPLESGRS